MVGGLPRRELTQWFAQSEGCLTYKWAFSEDSIGQHKVGKIVDITLLVMNGDFKLAVLQLGRGNREASIHHAERDE